MTKQKIDYSNTIIYKIVCKDITVKDVYVGHTTNFTKRKAVHKSNCNNITSKGYNLYVYEIIRLNGGWFNWDIIEIVKYPCNDTHDALKQERYYIEYLQATLNKKMPTRTIEEYKDTNKDKIKEQSKEYRDKNIDKLKEQHKEYYQNNINKIKELQKEYRANNIDKLKEQSKEYKTNNIDKIKQRKKEYRNNNKDKIKQQRKEYNLNNKDKLNFKK